jgi:hypothetical protein
VGLQETSGGEPATVTVEWRDGTAQVINAQHAVILDIFDAMEPVATRLQWEEEDKEM